jgi:hypothetical protein
LIPIAPIRLPHPHQRLLSVLFCEQSILGNLMLGATQWFISIDFVADFGPSYRFHVANFFFLVITC